VFESNSSGANKKKETGEVQVPSSIYPVSLM